MGTQHPSQKRGHSPSPIFGQCLLWPNGCMDQDATWYEVTPRPMRHCARWGPIAPLSLKGHRPLIFGQCPLWPNGWWTKMPLGMEVGLGPGDFVFDGDPATPRKKGTWAHAPHPLFGSCLLWSNGWMDEDATFYGRRPRPRPQCIRRDPIFPRNGHSRPPLFCPCLLWPRSPISATAELLFDIVSVSFKVGSVFGIGVSKYRDISVSVLGIFPRLHNLKSVCRLFAW